MMNNWKKDDLSVRLITEARLRVKKYARTTELTYSEELSRNLGTNLYFKWENHQPTGSFKIRGAANKILSNLTECRRKGVVSASTGNHGVAMAYVCQQEGLSLELYVPSSIADHKRKKLETGKTRLVLVEGTCEQAEALARSQARQKGQVFVSPYNDPEVIAGQGTCGLEIFEEEPEVDEVVIPVGGGGLISGVAVYLKKKKPSVRITGVEPENSAFIKNSLSLGRQSNDFPEKPTVADAVAGGIEEGATTFDLICRYVDNMISVSEEAIIEAMRLIFRSHQEKVEGAGALALAGLLSFPDLFSGKKIVAIVSGGNIAPSVWEKLVLA